ncbi:MAG: DUF4469 domain-containing protein [Bacteroides sp.]|nr:DUF4469 domain-containing protein [Bacteroides sp.]
MMVGNCDKKYEVFVKENVPVIKDIYDPLTGLHDGTITPNAPVVITGENLCQSSPDNIVLSLSPANDKNSRIRVKSVYMHTDTQVLMTMPNLMPGEYHPVVEVYRKGKVCSTYVLPVLWRVLDDGNSDHLLRRGRHILIG